jgi:signal peptidase I
MSRFLLGSLAFRRFKVEGGSMLPGLADRQYLLFVPLRFLSDRLHRGDIVVFRSPPPFNQVMVKRIVGLPNEDIRLESGLVYLNGTLFEEPYATVHPQEGGKERRDWWTGPDEYLLLGDNRTDSPDSRTFGTVAAAQIVGRVRVCYWPPRAWRLLTGTDDGRR